MADKTMVEKAGEAVGFGMAMAEVVRWRRKNGSWRGGDNGYRGSEEVPCEESPCEQSPCQKHRPENSRKAGHKEDCGQESCQKGTR